MASQAQSDRCTAAQLSSSPAATAASARAHRAGPPAALALPEKRIDQVDPRHCIEPRLAPVTALEAPPRPPRDIGETRVVILERVLDQCCSALGDGVGDGWCGHGPSLLPGSVQCGHRIRLANPCLKDLPQSTTRSETAAHACTTFALGRHRTRPAGMDLPCAPSGQVQRYVPGSHPSPHHEGKVCPIEISASSTSPSNSPVI